VRLALASWLCALVACGGAAATAPGPAPGPAPTAGPPGKVVEMGEFTVELPPGAWRASGDVSSMTLEIPRAAGIDESGGGFAFYDPRSDMFVHGFDGESPKGAADPAALVDALHSGADVAFAASWQVTHRDRKDAGHERRQTIAAVDAQGLSMQALIITIVEGGVVHGAGVQCVFKTAQAAERAGTCAKILGSLRRAPTTRPSSAAPSAGSS